MDNHHQQISATLVTLRLYTASKPPARPSYSPPTGPSPRPSEQGSQPLPATPSFEDRLGEEMAPAGKREKKRKSHVQKARYKDIPTPSQKQSSKSKALYRCPSHPCPIVSQHPSPPTRAATQPTTRPTQCSSLANSTIHPSAIHPADPKDRERPAMP